MNSEPLLLGRSLNEILAKRVEMTPNDDAFFSLRQGNWSSMTWIQFRAEVDRFSAQLRNIGVGKGTRVGILAPTSVEWEIMNWAVLQLGGVVVGLDLNASPDYFEFIVKKFALAGILAKNQDDLGKLPEELILSRLKFVGTLRLEKPRRAQSALFCWSKLAGVKPPEDPSGDEDWATLITTSGTTGEPKGIAYRHGQVCAAARAIAALFPNLQGNQMCWLPLSNLYQRILNVVSISMGSRIFFLENSQDAFQNLRHISPLVFCGVPRVFEKVHEGILAQFERQTPIVKSLFKTAMSFERRRFERIQMNQKLSLPAELLHQLFDRIFFARIRSFFGQQIKFLYSGSAPLPSHLLEFFHVVGLPIYEGYGTSENIVPNATNTPEHFRLGTVGRPVSPNHIRLAEDGEILVKGPGVFGGYEGDLSHRGCFTDDGYYKTGDLGQWEGDGFLKIIGRKSDIIKTSTGRRISPVKIEALLLKNPIVDQAVVVGNNKKFLSALISLRWEAVSRIMRSGKTITWKDLAHEPKLRKWVHSSLSKVNTQLSTYERIRVFCVLPGRFQLERGEITVNFKLRRNQIEENHSDLIRKIYDSKDSVWLTHQDALFGDAVVIGGRSEK